MDDFFGIFLRRDITVYNHNKFRPVELIYYTKIILHGILRQGVDFEVMQIFWLHFL
eukprot:GDKH01013814.1.p2 GENE.GDKH01013814.1~~GDKH01013814.1.p2  ORF type:complete len:56 (+),score=3.02 GDKH01013814.1:116-283(+)